MFSTNVTMAMIVVPQTAQARSRHLQPVSREQTRFSRWWGTHLMVIINNQFTKDHGCALPKIVQMIILLKTS